MNSHISVDAFSVVTYRIEVKCSVDFFDGKGIYEEWLTCGLPFSSLSQAEHTKKHIVLELLKTFRQNNPGHAYRLVKLTHSTEHYTHLEVCDEQSD